MKLFDILFEDEELLVINKPAGLVSHPTKGDEYSSLVSRVRLHLPSRTPHLINRLDRETSGIVIVAKRLETAVKLRQLWETRAVHKEYLAVVHGAFPAKSLLLTGALGKDPASQVWIKNAVLPGGEKAETFVALKRVFERNGRPFSLVRVVPRTGRKHQIRIHLSHAGYPIVGDKLYGGDENLYLAYAAGRLTNEQRAVLITEHHALHAGLVSFEWLGAARTYACPPEGWFREWAGILPGANRTSLSPRERLATNGLFFRRKTIHHPAVMATIAVLGTMDTKGEEHAYVADLIKKRGHQVLVIDTGSLEPPKLQPDVTREEVASAAGVDLKELAARRDRGETVKAMSLGAPIILTRLLHEKRIDGVISLGGGGGTSIATAAMRAMPIGFPKLMVSTLASGNTAQYLGVKDIVMMPSIVDVAGLNRISREILARAAGAICGMVETPAPARTDDKPIIVASMFGNTTACVQHAKKILEDEGFEVLVFHATGTGGRTMESLVEAGMVDGVLDITTTEWADELVGGFLSAGPHRLEAAAKTGTPAVVTPGCLDMVNFYAPDSVPERFRGRRFYQHNPQVTLMRTTPGENAELGRIIAQKLNASLGPVSVLIPKKAISVISAPGQSFHDPEADAALFHALKANLRPDIEVIEMDTEINDPAFAEACAKTLLRHIRSKPRRQKS